MKKIVIEGGTALQGRVEISGAKNATLPLMAAALLTDEPLVLKNIPHLSDIERMKELLDGLGVILSLPEDDRTVVLQAETLTSTLAPYEIVSKMRASILVLGPLLARCHQAEVSLPGGCAIGARPVNVHLEGLRLLGAEVEVENGYIRGRAPNGLKGATIVMPVVSVTGTENLIMAATLAEGTTVLKNAAKEPEVCDLVRCLQAMGAKIAGMGTDTLTIEGCARLKGTRYSVLPDRIEAATYAVAAALTHGDLWLDNVVYDDLLSFWAHLAKAGAVVERKKGDFYDAVRVSMPSDISGVDVMTEPFPGFPTDIQAQFMAFMTLCKGAAMITETIFENRFMHVPELCRMSADITIHKTSALVRGVSQLVGAHVMATDLRASVSLILAGLVAKGTTTVHRVYHIDRGYEQIEMKLRRCGAVIERQEDN